MADSLTAKERAIAIVNSYEVTTMGWSFGESEPDHRNDPNHVRGVRAGDLFGKIHDAIRAAVAEEREACASAVDDLYQSGPSVPYPRQPWGAGVLDSAVAIRARGKS